MKAAGKTCLIVLTLVLFALPVFAVTLEKTMTTRYVDTDNYSVTPIENYTFLNTDERVWLWFKINDAIAGDRPRVEWSAPDGTLYRSASWNPLASGGTWYLWDNTPISGAAAANKIGRWNLKVYYNNNTLFTLSFNILTLSKVTTRFVDTNNGCNTPVTSSTFSTTDEKVWLWFRVNGTSTGDQFRVEWKTPDNSIYRSASWNPLSNGGDWCFRDQIAIAGLQPGQWSLRVYDNNDTLFDLSFNITVVRYNSLLAFQVGADGRFNAGAFPDSATGFAGANSYGIMYRWPSYPSTSFTTIRIDGNDLVYGRAGFNIESPANIDAKTNRSRWQIGDIEVTQILQLAFNSQTGREDAIKIFYILRNTGTVAHNIGQRVLIDTDIDRNDGVPFRVPGVGIVRKEMEFTGANVPDSFQAFFDVTDAQRITVSTLKSGGATAPDRLVLAGWPNIFDTAYDYTIDPNFDFTKDSAYAVYWNPQPLPPGQSRTYTTFYGLSAVQVDTSPPLALGLSGPSTLTIVNGQYSPNPFDIVATVFNNGTAAAINVQLSLNLPTGLSLATGSATRLLGDLAVGQERQVSWSVRAETRSSPATLQYLVTTTASNAQTKNVGRSITIPAIVATADLALAISQSANPAYVGGGLLYTFSITNRGPDRATAVMLSTGNLPSSFFVDRVTASQGSCSSGTCAIGTLSNGTTATVTVIVVPMQQGDFSIIGNVSGNETDSVVENNRSGINSRIVQLKTQNSTVTLFVRDGNNKDIEINKNLDTIVLTHGLQGKSDLADAINNLWIGNQSRSGSRGAGSLIRERLGGSVNIVQYVWNDAFQADGRPNRDEYVEAKTQAINAGKLLAKNLLEKLGATYNKKIHFVGHSLGTVVNAYALTTFLNSAPLVSQAQFTALDRPHHINAILRGGIDAYAGDDFEGTYGYSADFFAQQFKQLARSPNPRLVVDNYFSLTGFGVGDRANPVDGVAFYNHDELKNPNDVGGKFFDGENKAGFDNNHSGVQQWYRLTVSPALYKDFFGSPICNGNNFNRPVGWDISLNPCQKGWYWSLFGDSPLSFPPDKLSQSLAKSVQVDLNYSNFKNIHGCQAQGSVICSEASSAFAVADMQIPSNVSYLSFDYKFSNVGDGDYAAILIDNNPVWTLDGAAFIGSNFVNTGPIPIRGLSGNRKISFALYGVGQVNAIVEFSNFKALAVSNPPILNLVSDQSVLLGNSLSFKVVASEPDGDLLTFSLSGAPAGASINASTGDFSWTPSATQIGSFSFKIRATDNSPDKFFAEQSITVTVTNPQQPNPVPTIISLDPLSATVGGAAFTLTVNGTNFVNGAAVRWNGSARNTIFVNSTQVMAMITASDIANLGTAGITVFNPLPGGGVSNSFSFTINPRSLLVSVTPLSTPIPGMQFFARLDGSGFDPAKIEVVISGPGCPDATPCVVPNNELTNKSSVAVTVPFTLSNGTFQIYVRNGRDALLSNSRPLTVSPLVTSVSAASFNGSTLAAESIVAAFGTSLATSVQIASSLPLPTSLAGTTVKVKDSVGVERLAPLFFVAPSQINYQIPPGTANGTATVTVTSGDGAVSAGAVQIASVAPGLFSVNASGQGLAAAVALRVRDDGSLSYESITRFDSSQNKFVAVPIDLGPPSDQVFLILYGTGWRSRSNLSSVIVKIGGVDAETLYAGLADGFVGLDQLNVRVPRSLAGRGEVDLVLTVDGKPANIVRASFR